MQHCISAGSGERLVSEYKTSVLYHNNSPRWNETVRVRTIHSTFCLLDLMQVSVSVYRFRLRLLQMLLIWPNSAW